MNEELWLHLGRWRDGNKKVEKAVRRWTDEIFHSFCGLLRESEMKIVRQIEGVMVQDL
jgi:hypothetical protein